MMFGKRPLFGSRIEPACRYCRHARESTDGRMILCIQQGVVAPYYACRRFQYDPLLRVPSRQPVLPAYQESDFTL